MNYSVDMPSRRPGTHEGAHPAGLAESPDGALPSIETPWQAQTIEQSHARCVASGLERNISPDFGRPDLAQWRYLLEGSENLRRSALPIMGMLHTQIARSRSIVVLTNQQGLILETVGGDDFRERAQSVALAPGVSWNETEKGTNAIGTALVDDAPTLVHADQHYLQVNQFLTCSATPVHGPTGELIGVLDVTGDYRGYHQHTMALVAMSAAMIENQLVNGAPKNGIRLVFHRRPEFLGTLVEAVACFDGDGRLSATNAVARREFGMGGDAHKGASLNELIGLSLEQIKALHEQTSGMPLRLHLADHTAVFARLEMDRGARLHAPQATVPSETGSPIAHASALLREASQDSEPQVTPAPADTSALDALNIGDPNVGRTIARVKRVLNRDISLLIVGDTGTGKEMLARAVHASSSRAKRPFVAVNCAAIPETLIESELFGYDEGAFTGAKRRGNDGLIRRAHGGTLFLDEIGDMPLALQARLLRVLQDRRVTRLGGHESEEVDFRLVCATHRRLREHVSRGEFREDLYYRINGLSVSLPRLSQRNDIDALIEKLLAEIDSPPNPLGHAARELLHRSDWPGNIRQLHNLLRTACALAGPGVEISVEHLSEDFIDELQEASSVSTPRETSGETSATTDLQAFTELAIEAAIARHGGNVSMAARELGISRNTIYRRLRKATT